MDDGKFEIRDNQLVKRSNGDVIPEDEPVFVFRARDYLALPILRYYLQRCQQDNCTEYQLSLLKKRIAVFEQYAADNEDRMKQPGITEGK